MNWVYLLTSNARTLNSPFSKRANLPKLFLRLGREVIHRALSISASLSFSRSFVRSSIWFAATSNIGGQIREDEWNENKTGTLELRTHCDCSQENRLWWITRLRSHKPCQSIWLYWSKIRYRSEAVNLARFIEKFVLIQSKRTHWQDDVRLIQLCFFRIGLF